MERLAWFEILSPHGEVLSRHPIYHWPVRVGRAGDSDVVLDDPYTASRHLSVQETDDQRYELTDLGTLNGLHVGKKRVPQATLSPTQSARIGQTHFRLRPVSGMPIQEEQLLPATAWWRMWLILLVSSLAWFGEHLAAQWLEYDREIFYNSMFISVLDQLPSLALWISGWAVLSRVLRGQTYWLQHSIIAILGDTLYQLSGDLSGYVSFAVNSHWAEIILYELFRPLLFISVLYLHLHRAFKLSRRKCLLLAGAAVVLIEAFWFTKALLRTGDDLGRMDYITTIAPKTVLLIPTQTPEQFVREAGKLQQALDQQAKQSPE